MDTRSNEDVLLVVADQVHVGMFVLIGVPAWVEVMIVELERMVLERSYGMKL